LVTLGTVPDNNVLKTTTKTSQQCHGKQHYGVVLLVLVRLFAPTTATNGSQSLVSNKNGERRKTGSWTLSVEPSLKLQECSSRDYLGQQQ
jgi:hypothetical protein